MGEKKELLAPLNEDVKENKENKKAQANEKNAKNDKAAAKKKANKKPNIFVRLGRKCKEVFSELKKVSWPTFAKVLKNTGIVLAVVLIFAVVITAFDRGLLEGIKALMKI